MPFRHAGKEFYPGKARLLNGLMPRSTPDGALCNMKNNGGLESPPFRSV
jgi:hypothetical protein